MLYVNYTSTTTTKKNLALCPNTTMLIETGNRLVVARGEGLGVGEMGKGGQGYKLPVVR